MQVTREKNCYCHTCEKAFHYLGITAHKAAHSRKYEECEITYTNGDTYTSRFFKISDDGHTKTPLAKGGRE